MSLQPLLDRLTACPLGRPGWREFEDVCVEILTALFVPPLRAPKVQSRTFEGTNRRDAVFPNWESGDGTNWGRIYDRYAAKLIPVEFKNYAASEIEHAEMNQTRTYLRKHFGKLALLCTRKQPADAAHRLRNTFFSDDGTIILFLLPTELKEMCAIKERGEDPSDLVLDLIDEFLLQHE